MIQATANGGGSLIPEDCRQTLSSLGRVTPRLVNATVKPTSAPMPLAIVMPVDAGAHTVLHLSEIKQ